MLLCYALEERAPGWTLGFAAACAAGSAYGFLQGAWPFGLVEAVWALVALRRWRKARGESRRKAARGTPQETASQFRRAGGVHPPSGPPRGEGSAEGSSRR